MDEKKIKEDRKTKNSILVVTTSKQGIDTASLSVYLSAVKTIMGLADQTTQ